jgi:hypothetical protein
MKRQRDTGLQRGRNDRPMDKDGKVQHLVEVTGDYPLEVGLATWAGGIGVVTLFTDPPSTSLAQLPPVLDAGWAITMIVGSALMSWGLYRRNISEAIANAMFLFSMAFAVYSITVIGTGAWQSSGAVGALTGVLAVVCYFRSRRLRELWRILLEEGERLHRTGSIPVVQPQESTKGDSTSSDDA